MMFKKKSSKKATPKPVAKKDAFLGYLLKFRKREKVIVDDIIQKYNQLK